MKFQIKTAPIRKMVVNQVLSNIRLNKMNHIGEIIQLMEESNVLPNKYLIRSKAPVRVKLSLKRQSKNYKRITIKL